MSRQLITRDQDITAIAKRRAANEAALTPSLPPELLRAIASGTTTIPVDPEHGGGVVVRERMDWEPGPGLPPAHIVKIAEDAQAALMAHLSPMDPRMLGAAVSKLLAHRWRFQRAEQVSEQMQEALLVDWLDDLGEFPAWAFHASAREWRRTREECPTIAGMRRLCEDAVGEDRRTLRLIGKLLAA